MDNVKLNKVRVSLRSQYVVESYETIAFSDRDKLLVNFALQLGYNVYIENVDDNE